MRGARPLRLVTRPLRRVRPLREPYDLPTWRIVLGEALSPEEEDYEIWRIEAAGFEILRYFYGGTRRRHTPYNNHPYNAVIRAVEGGASYDYLAVLGKRLGRADTAEERREPEVTGRVGQKQTASARSADLPRTTLRLDGALHPMIEALSVLSGESINTLYNEAIRYYLAHRATDVEAGLELRRKAHKAREDAAEAELKALRR